VEKTEVVGSEGVVQDMARRRCAGRNASGKRCGRSSQPNGWCWMCDPNITDEQRKAARSKGGVQAAKQAALLAAMKAGAADIEVDLSTPLACRRLLEALAKAVLIGAVHPQRSNALVAIANAASKANEVQVMLDLQAELERERSR